jgi:hypothetical protein
MSSYTPEQYAMNRDALLRHIVTFLRSDARFLAAWLVGSFGRGVQDNLSDLDLRIAVTQDYSNDLCDCGPEATTPCTSATRLALYQQFGQPLVLREDRSWVAGSCFNQVLYRETAATVDWVFIPQSSARIPSEECLLLFDKVGLPLESPPVAESLDERIRVATRDIGFFWLMLAVGIKYMLRGETVALYGFLGSTHYTLQELTRIAAGEPQRFNHGSIETLAVTRQEQIALIRQQCNTMLSLTPELVAMGASAPEDPMSVIEVWLSMAINGMDSTP